MARDGKPQKLTIGFRGGQVLAARVAPEAIAGLRKALTDGGSWHDLEAEDGPVLLDLAQVDYVRTDAEQSHVGFGG